MKNIFQLYLSAHIYKYPTYLKFNLLFLKCYIYLYIGELIYMYFEQEGNN